MMAGADDPAASGLLLVHRNALARRLQGGEDVVLLGGHEPDTPVGIQQRQAVVSALSAGDDEEVAAAAHQQPLLGLEPLRQAIAANLGIQERGRVAVAGTQGRRRRFKTNALYSSIIYLFFFPLGHHL